MDLDSNSLPIETLLHTKLEIPSLTLRVLRRARLTSLLERPGEKKVSILTAPAGYGKTTLLGEWLSISNSPDFHNAWVTLDLFDDMPFRFWSYLIAAVKKAYPVIKFREESLLVHGYDPLDFIKLIPLINEISNLPGYLNLILDDYHTISDRRILNSIAYLIDHQPKNMHLVISSRTHPELPLARLRTLGRLVEITAQNLAFSFDETRKYLDDTVKQRFRPDQITDIYENTEGWIAGLKMAVISRDTKSNMLQDPSYGINEIPVFPEYFSEEVLKNQDSIHNEFMLKTSILSEFSSDLCNSILEIRNSQQIIEELISKNLFIQPIDHRRSWFRFHPLFARSLLLRLQKTDPAVIPVIHRKALDWLLLNGYPEKAVVHALESKQEDQAAEIIDAIALQAIINNDMIKLIHWIDAIPDRLIRLRPRLGMFNAVASFQLGQYEVAKEILANTEKILNNGHVAHKFPKEMQDLHWQIDAIRAAMEGIAGNHLEGLAAGKRLLHDKSMKNTYVYALLTHAIGMALETQGKFTEAIDVYETARRNGMNNNYSYGIFYSSTAMARAFMKQGKLNDAKREFNQALDFAFEMNLGNAVLSLAQTGLLEIALQQSNMTEADKLAADILGDLDRIIFNESTWNRHIDRFLSLTNYFIIKQDSKNAGKYFELALKNDSHNESPNSTIPDEVSDTYVKLLRSRSPRNKRNEWWKTTDNFPILLNLTTPAGKLVQARIYLDQGKSVPARELLSALIDELSKSEYKDLLMKARVIFALSLYALPDKEGAFKIIEETLLTGFSAGYKQVFLAEGEPMKTLICDYRSSPGYLSFEQAHPGYLADLLKLFEMECNPVKIHIVPDEPVISALHPLQEPLSGREIEVLNLLVTDHSTKEMADSLMISINTTKTHIMNIYRKFGVHSRKILKNKLKELEY